MNSGIRAELYPEACLHTLLFTEFCASTAVTLCAGVFLDSLKEVSSEVCTERPKHVRCLPSCRPGRPWYQIHVIDQLVHCHK